MSILKWDKIAFFAGGALFATKGVQALASKTAHKAYVQATALYLRGREEVMDNVTAIREGCEDIYAEAQELNEARALAPAVNVEVIEDKSGKKTTKGKGKK